MVLVTVIGKKVTLGEFLQHSLDSEKEANQDIWASTTEMQWKFVENCLHLLVELKTAMLIEFQKREETKKHQPGSGVMLYNC